MKTSWDLPFAGNRFIGRYYDNQELGGPSGLPDPRLWRMRTETTIDEQVLCTYCISDQPIKAIRQSPRLSTFGHLTPLLPFLPRVLFSR